MRLRNITGSREFIADSARVVHDECSCRGRWAERFGNDHPIRIEIGCGKGRFIHEMAARHPEVNFIGIEKYSSVLLRALEKSTQPENDGLTPPLFIRMDAENICEVFAPGEVEGIYLNFSDPWPKDRHAKRRLPGRRFLERYRDILAPGGFVEFKTDNNELFDFALEELKDSGYTLLYCTRDLHADAEQMKDNVMTEYEERFSSMGNPINKYRIELK